MPIEDVANRSKVVSYGNRLFCDKSHEGSLHHRWGSGKLYRAYFQDYQKFLERPETAAGAETANISKGTRVVIIHSDLRQFYDRVHPDLLNVKMEALTEGGDDPNFFDFAKRLLSWTWHVKDEKEVAGYASAAGLEDFSKVALPQGLVSAGFFANISLLDFDQSLREAITQEVRPGISVVDGCRYVDDLRIVLTVDRDILLLNVEKIIAQWLQELLQTHAQGLEISEEKTKAVAFQGDERLIVRQSKKMRRIQAAISGGFDAVAGQDILYSIQGLIRSQRRYSEERMKKNAWAFSPIADVRDETVDRFAAGRFRSTYRSLRPLLKECGPEAGQRENEPDTSCADDFRLPRTQADLDDEVRAFALGLIETWVEDPSNVRLLRIGLDLWPAEDVLRSVLELLRPFTEPGGRRKAPRRVAWYCLSEIFRAGATETGFVDDHLSLPDAINLDAYRSLLLEEAKRIVSLPSTGLPWYLRQQVFLFLAANNPAQAPIFRTGRNPENKHYRELVRFLRGESDGLNNADFATLATLSRQAFLGQEAAVKLAEKEITPRRLDQIAERDPSFVIEILTSNPELAEEVSPRIRSDLCIDKKDGDDEWATLAKLVLQRTPNCPLRNELSILSFAREFLKAWPTVKDNEVITPSDTFVKMSDANDPMSEVDGLKVVSGRVSPKGSMYRPPSWCPAEERWRFQLGYLMRFILAARQDFAQVVRPCHWKEGTATYRAPGSHWYQRLYGMFNGHSAFGDDWLPISDWTEKLLFALLHWPGCGNSEILEWLRGGIEGTRNLIDDIWKKRTAMRGKSSRVLMLPLEAPRLEVIGVDRPLRVCVAQTVIPTAEDFQEAEDLTLSDPSIRRRHRNHLSAALAAIVRLLILRETHKGLEGRLDWLILPELSVHPQDVQTHLVPFARAHRTIITVGLTYQELFVGQPLVNAALWVIPAWSDAHGLQIHIRRQGKCHLAPDEEALNSSRRVIQGFRPCQWLVGYEWCCLNQSRPLWLTASVCYDATDIALAADLRDHSDVFAIPALNRDVNTFDNMAIALNYHMFQVVIVANNGQYGGSNAYAPYRNVFRRQIFHLHGQPQASLAFLEIENIHEYLQRKTAMQDQSTHSCPCKSPPAGV